MTSKPDYTIHEDRYLDRRNQMDIYAGWFTEKDYEGDIIEIKGLLKRKIAPTTGRLLDVGCGAGNYSFRLAELGFDVSGVDISQTAIDWARENCLERKVDVSLFCGDGIRLDNFKDNEFEFVFDGHFFHCIIGNDRKLFLQNVHRVLEAGGFFLVRSIVWPVDSGGGLEVDPITKIGYLDGVPYRYYPTADELNIEIEMANFNVIDWQYTVTTEDGYGFQHAVLQCRGT